MIEEESMRRARLQMLRAAQIDPYPASASRTHTIDTYVSDFETFEKEKTVVTLVGRIKTIRKHGGLTFFTVGDESGSVQFALRKDTVGEQAYEFFHNTIDMADFIEASGTAFVTKKGEKSLDVQAYRLITKTLLPLPEKWHGLSDTETRFRKRYLDLVTNPLSMEFARARSRMVFAIRRFMEEEGFMEVETPILQPIAGGAAAKPFVTHHNALDHDFYLRIAPELYLKRLLVGGFEKVYEYARCFRNEGISTQHNPEFTQIEAYWAYATIHDLLEHFERMLAVVVPAVTGDMYVQHGEDRLDFSNIARMTFHDAIFAETNIDIDAFEDEASLRAELEKQGMKTKELIGMSELLDHLWKTRVRPNLIQPTFILDYPAVMKPLAKVRPENPRYSAGAQLVVKGMEVINGFNEQNDPLVQQDVFEQQESLRSQGSEEAQMIDTDYVEALKHGMPPAAGYGVGIDRLAMILTGSESIKEVILFPTLRPESGE